MIPVPSTVAPAAGAVMTAAPGAVVSKLPVPRPTAGVPELHGVVCVAVTGTPVPEGGGGARRQAHVLEAPTVARQTADPERASTVAPG
ncbi:hypothetical protein DOU02_09060 [Clavibacter michiganensis subsp. michiganensis]|nr:hypothetical protein DOU02_09060 [Clavibacter michiganensis subsp. michiganensis]OUD89525.1 hypothetical protein CMMCAS05_13585 [Clavibacter michiganensis subsp. michiganensis]OUD96552.1 hypothetical protein CMMCAS04_02555 [Clavibacter michiganensis subsp. michiganensis]